MGDATHDMVPQLAAIRGRLGLVAGYVTGTPDVQWTPDDWARFPSVPHVTIDQGYQSPPVTTATVRDVEQFAWTPAAAVDRSTWSPAVTRQTIYCNRSDLVTVLADGWRGDLWLAIPGWQPGQPLPPAPGCTVVAVQNDYTVPAYDLSLVLDPDWPARNGVLMKILDIDRSTVPAGVNWPGQWLLRGDGTVRHIETTAELTALINAQIPVVAGYSYADWKALAGVA